ncbi:hypothetical protein KCU81_g2592, partial [Aureobasidium melanogenum]
MQPRPRRIESGRNFKEWLFQLDPNVGTRKDCISRSSALHLNSSEHSPGLGETVTCDLYNLHPKRRDECVCFPVHNDHVLQTSTAIDGVYSLLETTSVFCPPAQVVESLLLAAATQGPPTVCTSDSSDCPRSTKIIQQGSRVPRDLRYYPTPGLKARQDLAAQTAEGRDVYHVSTTTVSTSSNSWGPLPSDSHCQRDKDEKSLCKNDMCMWGFIKPWESSTIKLVTVTDPDGVSLFGSITESTTITTPHWGFLAPVSTVEKSTTTAASSYDTSKFKSKKPKSSSLSASSQPRVCRDELDCRKYCDRKIKAPMKHMIALLVGGTGFTALAGLAMLLKINGERSRRWRSIHNKHPESTEIDAECLVDTQNVQDSEVVQVAPDRTRSTGHVRFQIDGADRAVNMLE